MQFVTLVFTVARLLGPCTEAPVHPLQPRIAERLSAAGLQPGGVPEDPRSASPLSGCCALRKLCLPGLFPVIFYVS